MSKTKPSAPAFPIGLGSVVRYNGADAVIFTIREPGNPRSAVGLVLNDPSDGNRQRIANDVQYGLGLGCWITQAEIDADRPLTAIEAWQKAKAEGQRVPEVGLVVYFARNEGVGGVCHVVRRRLRISAVHSLHQVDGLVLAHRGDNPEAADVPILFHGPVRNSLHVSRASDFAKEEYFIDHWSYIDESTIVEETEPIQFIRLHLPCVCQAPSCRKRCIRVHPIEVGHPQAGDAEILEICDSCRDLARLALGPDPMPVIEAPPGRPAVSVAKPVEPDEAMLAAMRESDEAYERLLKQNGLPAGV